jgi:TPR repeat protein
MKKIAGLLFLGVVTTVSAQVEIKMREVTAKDAQSMLDIGKPKAAREIALQCAERNDADCQMVAAQLLLHGVGGKQDDAQAIKLLTASAGQNHAAAQALLGNLYFQGIGVGKDPATAVAWWVRSAENCNSWAQDASAHSYFEGEIVPQDLVRAYHWVSVAAHFQFPDSERGAASLGKMLAPEQRAQAEAMTKDFLANSGCGKDKQVIQYEPGTEQ